jgi:hypothetical protein
MGREASNVDHCKSCTLEVSHNRPINPLHLILRLVTLHELSSVARTVCPDRQWVTGPDRFGVSAYAQLERLGANW